MSSCPHEFKFVFFPVNFSCVNLINRLAKESRREEGTNKFSLPVASYSWDSKLWEEMRFIRKSMWGTCLVVQWLTLCFLSRGWRVWSLVRELRSHKTHGTAEKFKKERKKEKNVDWGKEKRMENRALSLLACKDWQRRKGLMEWKSSWRGQGKMRTEQCYKKHKKYHFKEGVVNNLKYLKSWCQCTILYQNAG